MMSAPRPRTCSGVSAFTAPCVPTGMKAGVRTSPCGVPIVPTLAAQPGSFAILVNSMSVFLQDQHAIPVTVETEPVLDGNPIGLLHPFRAGKGAHQQKQGRFREVEVRQQRIDPLETAAGIEVEARRVGNRPDFSLCLLYTSPSPRD